MKHRGAAWLTVLTIAALLVAPATGAEPLVRVTRDGLFKQRPAWSPDGKQLAFARHQGATIFLYLTDADGRNERRLTDRKEPEYDAVWSPDGARLAFAFDKTAPNQGDLDVYTIGADGANLRPLATTAGGLSHEESPTWSPDGKSIAYSSTRAGNQELFVAAADGSGERRLTNDPAMDAHPAWSPDGNRLAFATNRWGDWELATVDPLGDHLTRLTESAGLDDYPAWSRDGRYLAFTSNRDGNFEIYVLDTTAGHLTNASRHPAQDNFAAWTPDGRLSWVSNRDGRFDIYATREPWRE